MEWINSVLLFAIAIYDFPKYRALKNQTPEIWLAGKQYEILFNNEIVKFSWYINLLNILFFIHT